MPTISDDLRAAYDGLPHPAVILGRDGRARYVNPRARDLAPEARGWVATDGIPWEELIGRSDETFEGALETVVSGRATRIEAPQLLVGDQQYRVRIWRTGDEWVHAFFLPVERADSEEARVERGQEALLRLIPDFPHGACYVFDDRLRHVAAYGSELERDPSGRPRIVGKTLEEAYDDGLVAQLAAPYLRALSGRESDFVVRWDGRVLQFWTAGTGNGDGQPAHGIALVWDITESVTTEDSLRLVGDSIEALPLGVTVGSADRGAPILYANEGFARLSGYSADEVVGQGFAFMFGDDAEQEPKARIALAIRDGIAVQEVLLARRADGSTFWDRVTLSPISLGTDGVTRFIAVHEDVSDHRRAGQELQTRRRMGALGQLAGGIAHEMRNVLTSSGLSIELLADRHDLPEPVLEELRSIHDRLSQGASITDRLLTFARGHEFEREPIDLRRFVESRVDLLRSLLHDSTEIHFDDPHTPAWVQGNEGQLDQALINLATNAQQAMPEGGRLEFRLRSSVSPRNFEVEPPSTDGDDSNPWVLLQIRDHGVGMSEDVRSRAFEPFFTTRQESGASGLGLASVYGVVQELGGVTWIASREGEGTTVSIAFPEISHRPAGPAGPAGESGESGERIERRLDGLRILVAEDDTGIRHACARYLASRGAEVDAVPDGAAGWERLTSEEVAPYDLLVTDAVMPARAGQELIAEVRRRDSTVACVLMSGYTRTELPDRLERVTFLEKPFTMSGFAEAIDDALGHTASRAG